MKRILKKNQLIIAALAVMIAAAGYLNYSGRLLPGSQNTKEAGSDLANKELLDISDEDVASASGDAAVPYMEGRGHALLVQNRFYNLQGLFFSVHIPSCVQ